MSLLPHNWSYKAQLSQMACTTDIWTVQTTKLTWDQISVLIYDHLEDSVLAPRLCQYCSDSNCDGNNCESPFDHDDYNEASVFFTQNLSAFVINVKLERPLDSHAPQTEQLYMYDNDDWGETYEDESDNQWEAQDISEQYYETHEEYTAEEAHEEESAAEEQDQADSDSFDEDDQDNYMWHKDNVCTMDAYISEAQVVSCDEVDELHTEVIPPVTERYVVRK